MNQRNLFTVGFFAVLLVLLWQIALMFRPFLLPTVWAVILAHLMFPLHGRLTVLCRGNVTMSAALLTVGIMLLVVVPLVAMGFLLVHEAQAAQMTVAAWIQSGGIQRLPEQLAALPLMGERVQEWVGWFVVTQGNLDEFVLDSAKALKQFLVEEVTGIVENVFLLSVNFLVMILVLFFLFKDGARLFDGFYRVVPLDKSHKTRIFVRLDQTLRAVVKGVLVAAVAQGFAAGLAYAVLGAPFPMFLTAITMVLAPLPVGGTALVWGPVALYLWWAGPLWKALAMLAWGAGIVTMVDTVLKPWLIGQGAQIPVLFMFFSIVGGLAVYGIVGLFLGPIIVGLLHTAIHIYHEEYGKAEVSSGGG
ncbi:MAG: AI-2E family transporter [Nitrospirota bacterium]|nr:AI-2E family transporter [Nitrospirota bacterium]MDE3223890.1 AI-2E family transporter [Nitrospirota bacterium]MDE3243337.1 AI-2E family transporter [Nitrospirota bacterium]